MGLETVIFQARSLALSTFGCHFDDGAIRTLRRIEYLRTCKYHFVGQCVISSFSNPWQ